MSWGQGFYYAFEKNRKLIVLKIRRKQNPTKITLTQWIIMQQSTIMLHLFISSRDYYLLDNVWRWHTFSGSGSLLMCIFATVNSNGCSQFVISLNDMQSFALKHQNAQTMTAIKVSYRSRCNRLHMHWLRRNFLQRACILRPHQNQRRVFSVLKLIRRMHAHTTIIYSHIFVFSTDNMSRYRNGGIEPIKMYL